MSLDKTLVKTQDFIGNKWLLVFYQFVQTGADFITEYDEFLFVNKENKFSIWKFIDDSFKINGYFEFLIQYPEIVGYNHWRQIKNPIKTSDHEDINIGFNTDGCNNSWPGFYCGGLVNSSNQGFAFLDGSVGIIDYWFTIGAKKSYVKPLRFAGPVLPSGRGFEANKVLLWIKLNPSILKQISKFGNIKTMYNILLCAFSVVFISNS